MMIHNGLVLVTVEMWRGGNQASRANQTKAISGIPGNEKDVINIHGIVHNQIYIGAFATAIREKMNVLHMQQVKTITDRLKAQPEGNGTTFDNTMIMYFPEGGGKLTMASAPRLSFGKPTEGLYNAGNRNFHGWLNDFAVWNRTLTPEEIAQQYSTAIDSSQN